MSIKRFIQLLILILMAAYATSIPQGIPGFIPAALWIISVGGFIAIIFYIKKRG